MKILHSVTVVDTKVVAVVVVVVEVVDEVDSEMIEVEAVDTIDTLDDLSFNTSMPLLKSTDLKEVHTWVHHNMVCLKATTLTLLNTTTATMDTEDI